MFFSQFLPKREQPAVTNMPIIILKFVFLIWKQCILISILHFIDIKIIISNKYAEHVGLF